MKRTHIICVILMLTMAGVSGCFNDEVEVGQVEYFRKALPRDGWNSLSSFIFDTEELNYTFGSPNLGSERLYECSYDGTNIVPKSYANPGADQLYFGKAGQKSVVGVRDFLTSTFFLDEVDDQMRPVYSADIEFGVNNYSYRWVETLDIDEIGNSLLALKYYDEFENKETSTLMLMNRSGSLWEREIPVDSLGYEYFYVFDLSFGDDGNNYLLGEGFRSNQWEVIKLKLSSTGRVLDARLISDWLFSIRRIKDIHVVLENYCDNVFPECPDEFCPEEEWCGQQLRAYDSNYNLLWTKELIEAESSSSFLSLDHDSDRIFLRKFLPEPYQFEIYEYDLSGNELRYYKGEQDVFYNHIQIDSQGNYISLVDIQIVDRSFTTYLVKNPPEDPFSFY